jgi:glycosyltransferase involved in cell wall biosynthesis
MAKVSVCIPVYNGEKFLAKTISSVLSQTYKDMEILIVDNASTDGTPKIISGFKDERIRCVRNDSTISAAENWNRSVGLARGEYIALFHADDLYNPRIVEEEARVLDNRPDVGVVFSEAVMIDENDKQIGYFGLPKDMRKLDVITFKDLLVQLVRNNYNPMACPSAMARRSLYEKTLPYDGKSYRFVFDIDMYLKMAEIMNIAVIKEGLMGYRRHTGQGGLGLGNADWDQNEVYPAYEKYIKKHPDLLVKSDLDRFEAFKRWDYTSQAVKKLRRGDVDEAKKLLRRSLSWRRAFVSLLDINLLLRLWVSVFFFLAAYAGLGRAASGITADRRIGYMQ